MVGVSVVVVFDAMHVLVAAAVAMGASGRVTVHCCRCRWCSSQPHCHCEREAEVGDGDGGGGGQAAAADDDGDAGPLR